MASRDFAARKPAHGSFAPKPTATTSSGPRKFGAKPTGIIEDGWSQARTGEVPVAIIKQGRASGQLNLSNRNLTTIPDSVWRINIDTPEEAKSVSLDDAAGKWWDQTDLVKLVVACNKLTQISNGILNLPALQTFDAHDNQITQIDEAIGSLKALKSLNLGHNKLRFLPRSICDLTGLVVFHVENNELTELPKGFSSLINLEDLVLSENKLSELSYDICQISNLKKLNISNNAIRNLPDSLGNMTSLTDFEAHHNMISTLPHSIQMLRNLTRIDLRHNNISTPPFIAAASGLRELLLGNNCINSVGDFTAFPDALNILDLRDNKIAEIHPGVARLKALQRLDISNNDISNLPPQIATISTLKNIVLDGNPLRSIRRDIISGGTVALLKHLKTRLDDAPEIQQEAAQQQKEEHQTVQRQAQFSSNFVFSGKKAASVPQSLWDAVTGSSITTIDLSKNILTSIPLPLFEFQATIVSLNLSFNKLSSLPQQFSSLVSLVSLDLRNNLLSDLPDLSLATKLQDIAISMNAFTKIPDTIYNLPRLQTIVANDNRITFIDADGLRKLTKLACLDVTNNNIDSVPPQLGLITTLTTLKLEGNSFKMPRPAVLAQGTPAIIDYLRNRCS